MTARRRIIARNVGPNLSSKPAWPLNRIDFARQWYVKSAYTMVAMATTVKRKAEMNAGLSPKFNMPIARAPRITVKFSHDRKVRSLAKKTFGSTRVGRAIRLPLIKTLAYYWEGEQEFRNGQLTRRCLEKRLAGHGRRNCRMEKRCNWLWNLDWRTAIASCTIRPMKLNHFKGF